MSKTHVLYAVAVLFATFFALQFYLIHNVTKQREQFYEQVARKVARREAATKAALDRRKVAYDNINDFVSACQLAISPVFLADMDVLTAIMSNSTPSTGECRYLCSLQPVTIFAVDAKLWTSEATILQQLESEGFSVSVTEQVDPWSSPQQQQQQQQQTIRTHLSVQRSEHTVHLVLLHPRTGTEPALWWYGPCSSPAPACPRYAVSESNRHWLMHEGVIDVSELTKVTIDHIPLRAPRYPKTLYQQLPHSNFIHCNHTRAEQFRKQHGKEEDAEAALFKQQARLLLSEASRVLTELGIRFWISSGTCLGWFRQCDIIPYSKDVDLGIWIQDYDKRLIAEMQAAGMPLRFRFGKESDSFELSFDNRERDIKLDMFFFYEDEHYMWNGGTQLKTGKKLKYLFPKFSLCWTLLLGLKVRVPCQTESYIKANYGPDWFQPVKEWDWKKSPPNVWENGEWPKAEWPQVMQQL